MSPRMAKCSVCGGEYSLTSDGLIRQHGRGRGVAYQGCEGGQRLPAGFTGINPTSAACLNGEHGQCTGTNFAGADCSCDCHRTAAQDTLDALKVQHAITTLATRYDPRLVMRVCKEWVGYMEAQLERMTGRE